MDKDCLLILMAPNIGEQMGGEAMKALQIFRAISSQHTQTWQITHERCAAEAARLQLRNVHFVKDSWLSKALWRSVILRPLLDYWFSLKAVRLAERLAGERGGAAILHQTEPNSPVTPRALSRRYANAFGPINGNIYYPRAFRDAESARARARRVLHRPLQYVNRLLFPSLSKADLIFVAGGARTLRSLAWRGCVGPSLRETVDCGIADALLSRPRVTHTGVNGRFVHFGRLVYHKGTALIIESLRHTSPVVHLDIVGRGPELDACKSLVASLGLGNRVSFIDWYESHADLLDSLVQYRGVVLPSLEDANGIVVQEAMALGLPPICLDWGGPQLLVEDGVSGFLVAPDSRESIARDIAVRLDRLAQEWPVAEQMSKAARRRAEEWRWTAVASAWLGEYPAPRYVSG